jgi:hypothetical protein
MPRNFFRRIEVMFPVEDPRLKSRVVGELLQVALNDNVKARHLEPDGTYTRLTPAEGEIGVRSQIIFQALARESAREAGDSGFRFVPITGPIEARDDSLVSTNGKSDPGKLLKPPRTRSPRPRKTPAPT